MSIRLSLATCVALGVVTSITAMPARAGGLMCKAIYDESERLAGDFKSLDANADGQLSPAEFVGKKALCIPGSGTKKTFATLDSNKDGKLSVDEYRALPWHVVGRHCELRHSPVPVAKRPKDVATHADVIDEKMLKWSPPLTGKVYDRNSAPAVNALLTITRQAFDDKQANSLKVSCKSGMKALDTDDNGEVTQRECWRFLYTHTPAITMIAKKSK